VAVDDDSDLDRGVPEHLQLNSDADSGRDLQRGRTVPEIVEQGPPHRLALAVRIIRLRSHHHTLLQRGESIRGPARIQRTPVHPLGHQAVIQVGIPRDPFAAKCPDRQV
jgi:hypothetical protein